MRNNYFIIICCVLLLTACDEKADPQSVGTLPTTSQVTADNPATIQDDFGIDYSGTTTVTADNPATIQDDFGIDYSGTTTVTADNPATIQDDFTAGIAASQSSKPVGYADISTLNIETTRMVDYPVCSHLLGQPEPYPVIDNNTGKPLDLQPYVAMYPCIPPEAMTVCSHRLGEPKPSTQYDFSTGKPLSPQPYLKYYSCFRDDIRKVSQ